MKKFLSSCTTGSFSRGQNVADALHVEVKGKAFCPVMYDPHERGKDAPQRVNALAGGFIYACNFPYALKITLYRTDLIIGKFHHRNIVT
jgi:hypothetical protein